MRPITYKKAFFQYSYSHVKNVLRMYSVCFVAFCCLGIATSFAQTSQHSQEKSQPDHRFQLNAVYSSIVPYLYRKSIGYNFSGKYCIEIQI